MSYFAMPTIQYHNLKTCLLYKRIDIEWLLNDIEVLGKSVHVFIELMKIDFKIYAIIIPLSHIRLWLDH